MALVDVKQRAVVILVTGAAMISFSGVWVKLAQVSPMSSAFYRVFFGFLFLLPTAFLKGELKSKGKDKYLLAFACALFFALDLYFWHVSIHYIGPGLSTILANFQVFGLALAGFLFFREKLGGLFLISMPLAMLGLYLIVGVSWQELGADYKTGIYYGFATAACYTGFLLTLRRLQSDRDDFSLFFYLMVVSFFSTLILGGLMVQSNVAFTIPDLQSLAALVALALFSQFLGWVMIANAIPHIPAAHAGLMLLLQPALSFVWDVVFFARPTGLVNWAGVLVALGAIYLGMVKKQAGPNRNG